MKPLIVLSLLFSFCHLTSSYAQNWKLVAANDDDSLFYNNNLIARSHDIVKVWIKDKYIDPLHNHLFDGKGKVKRCTMIMTQLEFDLKNKLVKRLSVSTYNDNNMVLRVTSKSMIGNWEEIMPDSSYELTFGLIKNEQGQ